MFLRYVSHVDKTADSYRIDPDTKHERSIKLSIASIRTQTKKGEMIDIQMNNFYS